MFSLAILKLGFMEETPTCYWIDRLIERKKRWTVAETPMSEIKKTQQFNPQVNTQVDEIVTVVTENLFSGWRILDIISLFHYYLHQTDGFFHHGTVKSSLSCNTRFPYCLSHHIKCARNTSITRNPQHSHRYFISGKLRDNRKLQDFQRLPWQWVMNIHEMRDMNIRFLSNLRKLSVQDSSCFHVRCDFVEGSLGLSCEKDHNIWSSFSSVWDSICLDPKADTRSVKWIATQSEQIHCQHFSLKCFSTLFIPLRFPVIFLYSLISSVWVSQALENVASPDFCEEAFVHGSEINYFYRWRSWGTEKLRALFVKRKLTITRFHT